jgi:hypothetical protein
MIPHLYPSYSPAPPCEALECSWRAFNIDACREECCPYRWQREGAEDRARRETKYATAEKGIKAKEERLKVGNTPGGNCYA